jgi:hypothetical protein
MCMRTHYLTKWSSDLLEKLIFVVLLGKFPTIVPVPSQVHPFNTFTFDINAPH